ncbi:peroxisome assembly protein 12 isoform X2 [Amyelois transitella]|uniref:peroxisome assembly protein 12 isoform X2 n=1 Tax=Amyelois transitella TaxID=680683 RepID=UPI00298FC41F|nr:peroxisome assembly protein 12 isoform X2 [Amyelois transitella]
MAVYAAHLTRTLQGTPSIFQVTAQEALGATVKPALKKLVEYLAAVYPNKCGWCERWYDELYLLFDCCLQYHYLKHYAASFSESFYGLLRVPVSVSGEFSSGHHRLPPGLEQASLAVLVLLPYLKDKLETVIDKWREDEEDGRLGKDRLRHAAVVVYGVAHMSWSAWRLLRWGAFLTRGAAPDPLLAVLGLSLKHAPPPAPQPDDHTWSDLFRNMVTGNFGAALTFPMLGALCLGAVEYGAFAVQFLRWWEARGAPAAGLPAPPPPQRPQPAAHKNRCPLCRRAWRIPTVLPVSGYIFCYVCISRHVRQHSACPVTRCPASDRELVRLYID